MLLFTALLTCYYSTYCDVYFSAILRSHVRLQLPYHCAGLASPPFLGLGLQDDTLQT
jgi:hypothetical protein